MALLLVGKNCQPLSDLGDQQLDDEGAQSVGGPNFIFDLLLLLVRII